MSLLQVIILAIIQGLAELLPVSSSAHVVVAEKLLGLDPSSPPMTLLLVMLHTGTMFAVIVYFWKRWRKEYFQSAADFRKFSVSVIAATVVTGVIGEGIVKVIAPHVEIEDLFSHLELIGPALAAAGVLILVAGIFEKRISGRDRVTLQQALAVGAVQGLCLPFRGFSRSGATISTGMLAGVSKSRAESFSFALAVVLTPPVVAREALRLVHAQRVSVAGGLAAVVFPSVMGSAFAFLAGLIALKWLNRWLEAGRWYFFGIYCLLAAIGVEALHYAGY
jgi:undecaprenyl-diphosphatase